LVVNDLQWIYRIVAVLNVETFLRRSHLPSLTVAVPTVSFLLVNPKDSPLLQPSLPTQPSLFVKKAKYRHNHYIDSMVENHLALLTTRTEIEWLLGNAQFSKGYEYTRLRAT
jgi:hypothetical protein